MELTGLVQKLLDCNQEMLQRLTDLEHQNSICAPIESDDASTIRTKEPCYTPDLPHLSINGLVGYSFDEDLHKSRVYSRVRSYNSNISTISSDKKSAAWSYWSRISLSDVSNVSVLNLLITKNEIYNVEHYCAQGTHRTWNMESNGPAVLAGSKNGLLPRRILLLGTFYELHYSYLGLGRRPIV